MGDCAFGGLRSGANALLNEPAFCHAPAAGRDAGLDALSGGSSAPTEGLLGCHLQLFVSAVKIQPSPGFYMPLSRIYARSLFLCCFRQAHPNDDRAAPHAPRHLRCHRPLDARIWRARRRRVRSGQVKGESGPSSAHRCGTWAFRPRLRRPGLEGRNALAVVNAPWRTCRRDL